MALRETSLRPPPQWLIRWEIFVVLAVSLGASAVNALLSLIGSLLQKKPLAGQQALLVGSLAPFNHWLDLVLQLTSMAENLAPVVLVLYLMARSGEPPAVIGSFTICETICLASRLCNSAAAASSSLDRSVISDSIAPRAPRARRLSIDR